MKTKNVPAKRGRPAKKPETAIVKKAAAAVQAVEAVDAMTLLSRAVEANLPLETMERLLTMRREMKAEWAKEQYFAALAGFQHDCPAIGKEKKVKKKDSDATKYTYAPLEDIIQVAKPFLEKWGFSFTFKGKQENGTYTAICVAHHKDGHSEETQFTVPTSFPEYMNMSGPQMQGAACTYADRYAFKNAFGIVTKGEDTDAQPEEERKPLQAPQAKAQPAKPSQVSAPIPATFVEVKPESKAEFDQLLGTMEKAPGIDKLVPLFTENEKLDWRHEANEKRTEPEELKKIFTLIRNLVDTRRKAIKGATK